MKKLTAFLLSAAIVPALSFSTITMADKHDAMKEDAEQRSGQQHAEQQRAGGQQLSGKPAGAFYADDIIGKILKHRLSDEEIGEIQDLIIGNDGRIVGVVVKTGAFLGLGGQDVGLGWEHVEHTMEDEEPVFYTDINEDTLRESPKFERD